MSWRESQAACRVRYRDKYDATEADRYDASVGYLGVEDEEAYLSDLKRVFSFRRGMRILDAGAGTGTVCRLLGRLEGLSLTIPDSAVVPGSEVTLTATFTPARAMPVIADAIFVLSSNPRQPEIYVPVFGNAKEFRFDQTGP